jgi:hypothetical protein
MSNRSSISISVFGGSFWFVGWLFTLGYVGLPFWKAVLALIIWPYFLGTSLAVSD